ncbi:MAG TPA: hypothetical protein VGZ47_17105 [Gemmataceae bacterium]|jgi:hypothetical protein|nr:hypothetical protein [Gemmataceae bacterium]
MRAFRIFALFILLAPAARLWAAEPVSPASPSSAELAGIFRGLLLNHLPDPLVDGQTNWGRQIEARFGPRVMKNHGIWRKYRISAMSPAQTLTVDIRNLKPIDAEHTSFEMRVGFDAQIDFQQQLWERGLRLYSGSTLARAKVMTVLQCEVTTRIESDKGPLPDFIFRLRVVKAELSYKDLDVVHMAGLGGDGAKFLGEALHGLMLEIKPSLEKDLLERANAAIVKAGDTKEVRVSLNKLLKLGEAR